MLAKISRDPTRKYVCERENLCKLLLSYDDDCGKKGPMCRRAGNKQNVTKCASAPLTLCTSVGWARDAECVRTARARQPLFHKFDIKLCHPTHLGHAAATSAIFSRRILLCFIVLPDF